MLRSKRLLAAIMLFAFCATPALALTDASLDLSNPNVNIDSINGLDTNYTTINTVAQDNITAETNWTKFNLNAGETLNTNFQGQNQNHLIRVTGNTVSNVAGQIVDSGVGQATSRTVLVNPHGWVFANGSVVNVNSLIQSTIDPLINRNDLDFANGIVGNGIIEMNGASITTAQDMMFLSNQILMNNSNLTAGGKVQLVTADGLNFDLLNSGNSSIKSATTGATNASGTAILVNNSNITGSSVDMVARTAGLPANTSSVIITGQSSVRATNGDVFILAAADAGLGTITAYNSTLEASDTVSLKAEDGNINLNTVTINNNGADTKLATTSGNINLNTITVNGGNLDAITTNGDINDTASTFNSTDATFTTKTGDINLSNTTANNSYVELRNTNGTINVNDVDLVNNSYLNTLTNSDLVVNDLLVDNSIAQLRSHGGDVNVGNLTNTNNSYAKVESVDGDVTVDSSKNINNSTLLVTRGNSTTAGNISFTNFDNASNSYLAFDNAQGDLNVSNLNHTGTEVKFDINGVANIDNSTINGHVAASKAHTLNLDNSTLGVNASADLFDGNLNLDNVTADANLPTVVLANKNGDVQITNSSFNDLAVQSTGDATISTTTADMMTINADNILVHNLTSNTLLNNIVAQGNAQFEGDQVSPKGAVKFNNIAAGGNVLIHGGEILTENNSGTINAGGGITLWTETQDVNLQSIAGQTLDVDFAGNEVLATAGTFYDIQTSDNNTLTIDTFLDDSTYNRNFTLGAGQIQYPRQGLALQTSGTATLVDKRDDIDVRVSSDDADTISLDNFNVGHLNVETDGANSGDIYVYMPVDVVNTSFDAKSATEFVYYIYPTTSVEGDDEVNKIQALGGDLASQAPTPIALGSLVPLGAAAKFDANAKKHFVSVEDDGGKIVEYRVLKGLPYNSDNKDKTREIY